jgi:glycosyltransferase involved in cell wall biosynthesis
MNQSAASLPRGGPSITVFFPSYNDAEIMPTLIARAVETLQGLVEDYEIIVVDDGSTDQTPALLDSLQLEYPFLRVIRHPHNLGYGAALQSGFRNATKELIFYTDGDGQYDIQELRSFLLLMSPEVDVVTGYKTNRADSKLRVIAGRLYSGLTNVLFRLHIKDVDCDFRLIRRTVIESLHLTCRSGAICVDLMSQIQNRGWRVLEAPVKHYPRRHGRSQFFAAGPIARTLREMFRLWLGLRPL